MSELKERLVNAAATLQGMADDVLNDRTPEGKEYRSTDSSVRHHARLLGKREGVLLALSYLNEELRRVDE